MPENTPEIGTETHEAVEKFAIDFAASGEAKIIQAKIIQTETGFLMDIGGEPGTHEEMLEATKDWEDLGYTDDDVKDDLELLARAAEANLGLEHGAISATKEFRDLMSEPGVLEALMAEAVEQVRGPLHYRGDVAHDIMFQLVGPDRTGEALVPVEATYSIETDRTEVWYRVATPDDVENHVAAVGRSMA